MRVFQNRREAGRSLAAELARFKDEHPLILALPRGGVPVGEEIAEALDAPLDIVLVRKIGAPGQPELAAGAVVDGDRPETVLNDQVVEALAVPESYIEEESRRELAEIERRRAAYLPDRPRPRVEGRTAIVVDDGIATGTTARAALAAIRRRKPRQLVLAVPVAPPDTLETLGREVDEVVCLESTAHFFGISQFYEAFEQLGDDEVRDILERATAGRTKAPPAEGPA